MTMGREVLFEQIFPIVISIRRPDGGVDVILCRDATSAQCDGALVIKLDEDNRAVDTVVEHRVGIHFTDPGKASFIEMFFDLFHFHLGVSFFQIMNPESSEFKEGFLLIGIQFGNG